jgi:DNA invertase Pin-like site-specific DNA recombinase
MSENETFGFQLEIDQTRAIAVYTRQADQGADTEHSGSSMILLALQNYGTLLFGESEANIRLYDEGAGASGRRQIDQRKELERLCHDIENGTIGTIITAGESRLFRDAHPAQVTAFTQLARKMRIALIIPSALSGETRLYDFANSEQAAGFEEEMTKAYEYIRNQIRSITPRTTQK